MQAQVVHTVTTDLYHSYRPWVFRPAPNPQAPPIDPLPPAVVVLHAEATWFLSRAQALNQGIGFCGIMTVATPANSAPATIYLWPLQTPHTIRGGVQEAVPGMEDLHEWPEASGFSPWANGLAHNPAPALKFFKQANKNLHVIPKAGALPRAPAHAQLQQAITALENTAGLSFIGFSLYFNVRGVANTKNVTFAPSHHLLRCLSRSQNGDYFTNLGGPLGTMPDSWAAVMRQAIDDYLN